MRHEGSGLEPRHGEKILDTAVEASRLFDEEVDRLHAFGRTRDLPFERLQGNED